MPQSLSSLNFHFVFSTQHRRALISREIEPELHKYIAGVLGSKRSRLLTAGGMPDHLQLLVSLDRQISVSEALRDIKANSSRWIRRKFSNRKRFGWQTGYAAFSVSFSQIKQVRHYIETQKSHHQKRTFKEELVGLLKMHRMDFEERYLWD